MPSVCALPRSGLAFLSLLVSCLLTPSLLPAQQLTQRPAPWTDVAPPAAILGLADVQPVLPLEFSRAWLGKVQQVGQRREHLTATGRLHGMTLAELVREGAALTGNLRIPVIPITYADGAIPFAESALDRRLFGPGAGDTVSFSGYWDEVSSGLLEVTGSVSPWVRLSRPAAHYLSAAEHGWSRFGRIVELREEAIRAADQHLDFAQFDNDGPDGNPNSGDDDGFVDFIALVYALPCPGDGRAGGIWPHRAAMAPIETEAVSANGGAILVADYVILPVVDPQTCGPLHVGVLAHETGHALGLPDLYDYDGSSAGIGPWGLMGTGSHAARYSPAHPGAWEKEQLGWVTVRWLEPADSAFRLEPVQRDPLVYRWDDDDFASYLLFENRQPTGSDRRLPGNGMLVWQIDPERGELGAWNIDERRAAVRLLASGSPGTGDELRFRDPDAVGNGAGMSFRTLLGGGLLLDDIALADDVVHADLTIGTARPALVPTTRSIRLTALAGGTVVHQTVEIARQGDATVQWSPRAFASWLRVERTGDVLHLAGDPVGLPPGSFLETVDLVDSDEHLLSSVAVSLYIATPGVGQIVATELPWSWGLAVHGGRILQASYGWDQFGVRPRPRVLQLREGSTHPGTLARLPADALYAPVFDHSDGSSFVLARARDENYLYQIRSNGSAEVLARVGTSAPAYGAAVMPDGRIAVADWSGNVYLVTRDGHVEPWLDLHENIYQIASDDEGNLYAALFSGDVLRIDRRGQGTRIPTGFGAGRLVTVAVTPAGDVLAAERGGAGRILRIRANGSRDIVFHQTDARFFGLAVDEVFLYALDLKSRQLLRIPLPDAPPFIASDRTP